MANTEKILGIGHIFWLFLLPYILLHIGRVDASFSLYLGILAVFLAISLVFDVVDCLAVLSTETYLSGLNLTRRDRFVYDW